jgi:hypothetical protein
LDESRPQHQKQTCLVFGAPLTIEGSNAFARSSFYRPWSVPHCIGASLTRCGTCVKQQIRVSGFGSVRKSRARGVGAQSPLLQDTMRASD